MITGFDEGPKRIAGPFLSSLQRQFKQNQRDVSFNQTNSGPVRLIFKYQQSPNGFLARERLAVVTPVGV